jgi:hypothetical protein
MKINRLSFLVLLAAIFLLSALAMIFFLAKMRVAKLIIK